MGQGRGGQTVKTVVPDKDPKRDYDFRAEGSGPTRGFASRRSEGGRSEDPRRHDIPSFPRFWDVSSSDVGTPRTSVRSPTTETGDNGIGV